jgi:hypothetical protein
MSWAPSVFDGRGTTGIFVTDGTEWHAYPAARRFLDTIRDYDGPSSRVYAWYRGTLGLTNIAWTTLPQDGHTVQALGLDAPFNGSNHLVERGSCSPTLHTFRIVDPSSRSSRRATRSD